MNTEISLGSGQRDGREIDDGGTEDLRGDTAHAKRRGRMCCMNHVHGGSGGVIRALEQWNPQLFMLPA